MTYSEILDTYEKCFYCWLQYFTKETQLRMVLTRRFDFEGRPLINPGVPAYRNWNGIIYNSYIHVLESKHRINPKVIRSAMVVAAALGYDRQMEMLKNYKKEKKELGVEDD